jgi:hypothetical protein
MNGYVVVWEEVLVKEQVLIAYVDILQKSIKVVSRVQLFCEHYTVVPDFSQSLLVITYRICAAKTWTAFIHESQFSSRRNSKPWKRVLSMCSEVCRVVFYVLIRFIYYRFQECLHFHAKGFTFFFLAAALLRVMLSVVIGSSVTEISGSILEAVLVRWFTALSQLLVSSTSWTFFRTYCNTLLLERLVCGPISTIICVVSSLFFTLLKAV